MNISDNIKSYIKQTDLSNLMSFDELNYTRTNISKFYKILGYAFHNTVNLIAVANIVPGESVTKNKVKSGSIPVIAGGVTSPYSINKSNRPGDIITISQSGSAGYVWYHKGPIFASDCFTVKANSKTGYSTQEIYYLLKLKEKEIVSMGMGSVQHHVYARNLYKFQMPILNNEQHRIFRQFIINTFKAFKAHRNEYTSLKHSLMSLSEDAYNSTDNKVKITYLEQDGYLLSRGGKRIPKQDDYCPFPTIHYYPKVKDFDFNSIDLLNSGYIDSHTFNEIKRYILLKNDVYLSIAGTIGTSGIITNIPTYYDKNGKLRHKTISLTENAMKFTHIDSSKLMPLFLDIQIKSKKFKSILHRAELNNDTPKLSLNNIRACKLTVPSMDIQQMYCHKWLKLINTINKLKKENKALKQRNLLKNILND